MTTRKNPFPEAMRGRPAMDALAKRLADNYFDVTFGYPPKPETFFKKYSDVFDNPDRNFVDTPRVRNVVVIGAGASYAAFGGELFPMAREAIDRLRTALGVDGLKHALRLPQGGRPGPRDRVEEEEQLFHQLYGTEDVRYDFESQLTILSKFYNPHQIREAIGTIYAKRYYPHIVYETIAHLLKHRFVDVVINYNFDEVLDQAIEEELRRSEYRRVISDGDCDDLSRLVVDEQLKVPLYIKPHGTISHKSTLRFTKDAYVGMPSDLLAFTKKILFGDTKEDPSKQRDRFHVNLISIGFAFTSVELIGMLQGHDRLNVFHVNLDSAERARTLHDNVSRIGGGVKQYLVGIRPADTPADEAGCGGETWPSIEKAVADLFGSVSRRFNSPYQPRHLVRHELIHRLLFSPAPEGDRKGAYPARPQGAGMRLPVENRYYLLARLYIELTLALAKGNGRIDLGTLVGDRVGTYFREWRSAEPGGGVALREICARLCLVQAHGFTGTVFTSIPVSGESASAADPCRALAKRLWSVLVKVLKEIDDGAFRDHVRKLDEKRSRAHMVEQLTTLAESDAHELTPQFGPDALLLLNQASSESVIHTSLGLTTRFMELLDNHDWDLLLAVSEHGKVLRKLERHMENSEKSADRPSRFRRIRRRASVVVADAPDSAVLDARLAKYREAPSLLFQDDDNRLPYWAHNDHMVIVLRMGIERGAFDPLAAIYYRRNGLDNRVNPVFVQDADDLELLVQIYFGYVTKARTFKKQGGVPDVDHGDAEITRSTCTRAWWDAMVEEAAGSADPARIPVGKVVLPDASAER